MARNPLKRKRAGVSGWTLAGFLLPAAALVFVFAWSQTGEPLTAQAEIRRAALALERLAVEELELRVGEAALGAMERPLRLLPGGSDAARSRGLDAGRIAGPEAAAVPFCFARGEGGALVVIEPPPAVPKKILPLPGDERENERYRVLSSEFEEREFIRDDPAGAAAVLDVMESGFEAPGFKVRTRLARASFLVRQERFAEAAADLVALIDGIDPAGAPGAGGLPFMVSALLLLDKCAAAGDVDQAPARDKALAAILGGDAPLTASELAAVAGRLEALDDDAQRLILERSRGLETAEALMKEPAIVSAMGGRSMENRETFAVVAAGRLWLGGTVGAQDGGGEQGPGNDGGTAVTRVRGAALSLEAGLAGLLRPESLADAADGLSVSLEPLETGAPGASDTAVLDRGNKSAVPAAAQDTGEVVRTRSAPAGIAGAILKVRLTDRSLFEEAVQARRTLVLVIAGCLVLAMLALGFATFRAVRREVAAAGVRSDFMAAVSHELRTPLASIRTFAELLEENRIKDGGTRQRFMRLILSNCRRLSALIENVLDLSRSEQGQMQFHVEEVDLKGLLDDLFRDIRAAAEEEGFAVNVAIEDRPPPVAADPTALARAIFNICDNARKYAGDKKSIAVRAAASAGGVSISISDRGPGIPPAERERIFEPFQRGRGGAGAPVGVGLGLSLAREAVAACGGRLELESREGEGSTFTIFLPRIGADA